VVRIQLQECPEIFFGPGDFFESGQDGDLRDVARKLFRGRGRDPRVVQAEVLFAGGIVNCCGRENEGEVRSGRSSQHSVQEFDARHNVGEELEAIEFTPGFLGLAA